MGYLQETRQWLTELLEPFIKGEVKLKRIVDSIADEILVSYKNGIRDAKQERPRKRTKRPRSSVRERTAE